MERETLGLYVSDHPLFGRESQLAQNATHSIGNFVGANDIEDGSTATLCGLVTGIQNRVGKKSGKPYLLVTIEDFEGETSFMLTGKSFGEYVNELVTDMVIAVRGRVNNRDDGRNLSAYSIQVLDAPSLEEFVGKLHIRIDNARANRETLEKLQYIIKQYPGKSEMVMTISSNDGTRTFSLPQKVKHGPELVGELKILLGVDALSGDSDVSSDEPLEAVDDSADQIVALEVDQGPLFDS
jgi:DNA polymerase-3 subunit alpha